MRFSCAKLVSTYGAVKPIALPRKEDLKPIGACTSAIASSTAVWSVASAASKISFGNSESTVLNSTMPNRASPVLNAQGGMLSTTELANSFMRLSSVWFVETVPEVSKRKMS